MYYGLNLRIKYQNLVVLTLLTMILSGCITIPRGFPAPNENQYTKAEIPGFKNIRFWGDETPPDINERIAQQKIRVNRNLGIRSDVNILALSGGGEDGAYGAGFLKGWTERGNRPEFFMVTGVSAGALIAPFAFLGSEHDDTIKRLYTETSKNDIFILTPLTALLGGSAVADTTPLRRIIAEEVDDKLVAKIARESRRGRLLWIGTTDLDAQRPVIWDIGRIAESGHPDATQLIGKIMLASASIPGAFPPVTQNVIINGKLHQEVHVDGGVTNQIFIYPLSLDVRELQKKIGRQPKRKAFWLIRNTKIDPEYETTRLNVPDIAERSINTLIKYQGRGDLITLAKLAERDGFELNMTHVPKSFDVPLNDMFDPVYMRALYKVGYQAALSDEPWDRRLDDFFNN